MAFVLYSFLTYEEGAFAAIVVPVHNPLAIGQNDDGVYLLQ